MLTANFTALGLITLILTPFLGKIVQWLINLLKQVEAFANANAEIKQFAGVVISALLGWISTTLALHFTGTSFSTMTVGDTSNIVTAIIAKLLPAIVSLITWLLAMVFHTSDKTAVLPPVPATVTKTTTTVVNQPSA